jgi:hypothetical protein
MKAIVMHEYGGPEVLQYGDYPDPAPSKGEVLIRATPLESIRSTCSSAIFCKLKDGRVSYMQLMEDTFCTASSFRSWRNLEVPERSQCGEVEV